jgi:hypothetical protein
MKACSIPSADAIKAVDPYTLEVSLSGSNGATAVCGRLSADGQSCASLAEMTLVLGDEDNDGIHDLILKDDGHVEMGTVEIEVLEFAGANHRCFVLCNHVSVGGEQLDLDAKWFEVALLLIGIVEIGPGVTQRLPKDQTYWRHILDD